METLDGQHRLAIGDRLSFRIEEESKSLVVADSGEIELPGSLGRFAAADKTCKELARIIKTELEKEYCYHATVMIYVDLMARSRGKVYLVGYVRVRDPQEIPSDEELTLSKAILRAGGFTEFANKSKVKETRTGEGLGRSEREFIVDVGEILEKGRTEFDVPLQPNSLTPIPPQNLSYAFNPPCDVSPAAPKFKWLKFLAGAPQVLVDTGDHRHPGVDGRGGSLLCRSAVFRWHACGRRRNCGFRTARPSPRIR